MAHRTTQRLGVAALGVGVTVHTKTAGVFSQLQALLTQDLVAVVGVETKRLAQVQEVPAWSSSRFQPQQQQRSLAVSHKQARQLVATLFTR